MGGRTLQPTVVFDTYWRFAWERQQIYYRRLSGDSGPWTGDTILQAHRFTNAFRAADRTSQYLISDVIYKGSQEPEEIIFRTLLFKFFNKIETWELLTATLGTPTWAGFDMQLYAECLGRAAQAGQTLYSAAYVIPPPRLGAHSKAENHLRLLSLILTSDFVSEVVGARAIEDVYRALVAFPSIGRFIGFQLSIDLNYSSVIDFDEMDFVVAGPGAVDGIRKCFGSESVGLEDELIRYVAKNQDWYFSALGLDFAGLFGRPLQLIDCQNLFCEVDKYARVAHPEVAGVSGRERIKQRFRPLDRQLQAWFPPKWGLDPTPSHGARPLAAATVRSSGC